MLLWYDIKDCYLISLTIDLYVWSYKHFKHFQNFIRLEFIFLLTNLFLYIFIVVIIRVLLLVVFNLSPPYLGMVLKKNGQCIFLPNVSMCHPILHVPIHIASAFMFVKRYLACTQWAAFHKEFLNYVISL